MSDFSSSGIYGMPSLDAAALTGVDTLDGGRGDSRVVGWLREAILEGDRINQADPSYDQAVKGMEYIVGEQFGSSASTTGSRVPTPPSYLPRMTINEARKVTQAHASVLTDLKPVWGYKSENPAYAQHGYLLNNLIIAWYVNTMADLELGNTVKLALAAGTADTLVEWDPHARFGGDHRIMARDFRDTLPWRPAPMSRDVQDWQGVIFREEHSLNVLRGMYPTKAALFQATSDSLLSTLMGRFRSLTSRLVSPAVDTLGGLTSASSNLKPKSGHVLLYRTFLDDQTRNLTLKPIPMGPPGAAWAYVVPPGERLYPNKRCIVATPDAIVWDGPSPFWHGLFPFSRLKLWEVPWQFLGVSLLNDLIPVQDGINDLANDLRLGIKQWMDQTTVYDRQAVSENFMRLFDPRRPGAKVKTNPTYGDGFKKLDGPNPQVLALGLEFLQQLISKFGDLSGVANLETLLQLRQMPGADTIRTYYEAQTPTLRSEGRMIEAYIRPIAEMLKVNTFQYMTQAKRVTLLGEAALTLEDFDFDPGNLVPALQPGQPGYTPELDADLPREQRAQFFHKLLTFRVTPNSLLAMDSAERKMLYLTLAREGVMDILSLLEVLEVPNIGKFPPIPLPPLKPPQDVNAVIASLLGTPTGPGGVPPAGQYTLGPNGELLEIREPLTVLERLQAQQLLGLAPAAKTDQGRPPTAQASPHGEMKADGEGGRRPVVSETNHGPSGPPGSQS